MNKIFWLLLGGWLGALSVDARAADKDVVQVGFAKTDITPKVDGADPVWIAGYGNNRKATGVHDPLHARAVVLADGTSRIAMVSVDLVGLQLPAVEAIRRRLPGFDYVLVSSTHNHEGPDVIGLWGPSRGQTGVDPAYLALVENRVVEAVEKAAAQVQPARARYGTAADAHLLHDARLPIVFDDVLRLLVFEDPATRGPSGILMQWNCHPEILESKNTLITTDFVHATIDALESKHACPVAYFTGTVGGLMTVPENRFKGADGRLLAGGSFETAEVYGKEVAKLADKAIEQSSPIALSPMKAFPRRVALPLDNPGYRIMAKANVLTRAIVAATDDPYAVETPASVDDEKVAIASEVAYLRLGELHVACIPGEIYPELVNGKFQEPVDPGADFPDAPLEPHVAAILPGPKTMLIGLANDEVGYIIPLRQWDHKPPYAYKRERSQYGEVNSCGPQIAPVLMQALVDCVKDSAR